MAAHGLDLRRLHIVPNGISPDDWEGVGAHLQGELAECLRMAHARGDLVVGYAGSHGLPNALDTLLDVATLLKDKAIQFILVGGGHEKLRLQQRVVVEGLNNAHLFAPIPKAQIPSLLREFDIAYIGFTSEPLYRFGVSPNKLMDYMMAAKPVVFSVQAGNDSVAEASCGLTVPPGSPRGIADGVLKLAGLTVREREIMGLKGRAYVQEHNTYLVLARKFLSIMEGET